MKVVVRCAHNRVTKADMEREIERLFQENKDLRVEVGHLNDEINMLRQQNETRRQIICERDKLIQELNEQVQASEDELENTHCDLVNQKQLQEEMCNTIDDLRIKLAKSEKESSQGMSAMAKFWEEAISEKNKAEERAEEYRIALMESDCRVDECEKRIEYLENEVRQTEAIANQVIEERDELSAELVKHESKHYQQEAEEWKMTANKLSERVQDLNAQLHEAQADYNELSDSYSDVQTINRDYAQEIDRLRKLVTELQTHRFTLNEVQNMICKYLEGFEPSAASFNF